MSTAGPIGGRRSMPRSLSSIRSASPTPAAAPVSTRQVPQIPDVVTLYRRMGLLAVGGETPFVGTLSFFAGSHADSTTIVLTVALANRTLQFEREGDRYRANYQVGFDIRQGGQVIRELRSRETVRVIAFRETSRADESVLYRQIVRLAPGTYDAEVWHPDAVTLRTPLTVRPDIPVLTIDFDLRERRRDR